MFRVLDIYNFGQVPELESVWIGGNPYECDCDSSELFKFVTRPGRVSVQGVKSLGGHFACLCRGFEFYEVKKKCYYFSKRKWKYFYILIIFIVKSLQKEQNSTNLLL